MLFGTLPTNLLQIFGKIIPNFEGSVKDIVDPDDLLSINGLNAVFVSLLSSTSSANQALMPYHLLQDILYIFSTEAIQDNTLNHLTAF